MRKSVVFIASVLLAMQAISKDKVTETFNETYRPQVHFTPAINKMGSPISLVRHDSLFYLYYQYNPFNLQQGYVHWGAATSSDLLHWKHNGIVLMQPESVSDSMMATPWWGTVFNNNGEMHAIFNRWGNGIYETTLVANNPNPTEKALSGDSDFLQCDPFVFWHHESSKWVMLAYDRRNSVINFFNSSDRKNWEPTGVLKHPYGFPSLYKMPVDRKPDDTRWVLFSEKSGYVLGQFDGKIFTPTGTLKNFDGSRSVGGTVLHYDETGKRFILVSELKSDNQADMPSNGQLSFPNEVFLHETTEGVELYRKPIAEIVSLCGKGNIWENKKIYPGLKNNLLAGLKGDCFYMKGVIDLKNCDQFGFVLRSDKKQNGMEVGYHVNRKLFSVMSAQIGYIAENNKIDIEMIIDRSSVEVFLAGGRFVVSETFSPEPKNVWYELITKGGEIMVDKMEVYPLRSVWATKK